MADSLAASFEEFVLDPRKARQHAAAMPFFDNFSSVHHIAAVATTAAIDQMSRRQRYPTFMQHLGLAIERETRLIKLGKKAPMEMRSMMRHGMSRKSIAKKEVMRAFNCPVLEWNDMTRLQVGAFLAQPIFDTELLTTIMVRKGKTTPRLVVPTKQAEGFIRSCRPAAYRINQLSMLVPPRDWQPDLYGGGQLDNHEPLVKPVLYDASRKQRSRPLFGGRSVDADQRHQLPAKTTGCGCRLRSSQPSVRLGTTASKDCGRAAGILLRCRIGWETIRARSS